MKKLLIIIALLCLPAQAQIISGNVEYHIEKDRKIGIFSDGSYGVNYYNDPLHVWYYKNDGMLIYKEIKTSEKYPYKTYKYTTDGILVNTTLRVSENETFIYSPKGNLIAHWLDDKCFDNNNNIVMTRKIKKE